MEGGKGEEGGEEEENERWKKMKWERKRREEKREMIIEEKEMNEWKERVLRLGHLAMMSMFSCIYRSHLARWNIDHRNPYRRTTVL